MAELKETKLYFKMRGKIGGLTDEQVAKNTRDDEKKIQHGFSIRTNEDNVHYLQMTQWKSQIGGDVYISKKEDGNFQTQKISWDNRDKPLKDGWSLIGVGVKRKAKDGEKAEDIKSETLVPSDAFDFIKDNFENGDSVFVQGKVTAFESSNGTVYKNYEVDKVYATSKEVDFKADDFEELAEMSGELIFVGCSPLGSDFSVDSYYVGFSKKPTSFELLIPSENKEMAHAIMGGMEYGEGFKGFFNIHNRVVYKEVEKEEEVEQKQEGGMLFGKKAKSFETNTYTQREIDYEFKHIELIGIEAKTDNTYTYDDLVGETQEEQASLPWA